MNLIKTTSVLVFLFCLQNASCQEIVDTLSVRTDSYVTSKAGFTGINYGADGELRAHYTSGVSTERFFLSFNFSTVPSNAIITSATLLLETDSLNGSSNLNLYVERVDSIWNHDSISWDNQPSTYISDQISISNSIVSAGGLQQFDVTEHVQHFVNYSNLNNGWLIRLQDESSSPDRGVFYYSKEYNSGSKKPKLEIKYILPMEFGTSIIHCTSGNEDGELEAAVTNGSGVNVSSIRIHKINRDYGEMGAADLVNVTSSSNVGYNSGTGVITASDLAPGFYRLRVDDLLYASSGSNSTYRFYKYFLVGRVGDTISGILLPSVSYQENVRIARDKPGASPPTDLENTNQSSYTNLYVSSSPALDKEYASLIQYFLDFDNQLEFTKAELTIKSAAQFYRGSNTSNATNYSLVTSPWQEKVVTWNTRPSIDSSSAVYIPTTTIIGYDTIDLFDTVSILSFVEFWQENPKQNFGFEMALEDYNNTKWASRNYKGSASNENFIEFQFVVRPNVVTSFDEVTNSGNIEIFAPTFNGPYKYLLSYEPLPTLNDIWQAVKDSIPVDSATFFAGDVNSREFVFEDLPAERYYVTVFDYNGTKILEEQAILSPELLLYESTAIVQTDLELRVDTLLDTVGFATFYALLRAEDDGGFDFKITNLDDDFIIGFNKEFDTLAYEDTLFEFGFKVNAAYGEYSIVRGTSTLRSGTVAIDDEIRIAKNQGDLIVYKNGVEEYSYPFDLKDGAYKLETKLKGPLAWIQKPALFSAFKRPRPLVSDIVHPECPSENSSFVLTLPPGYFAYQSFAFFIKDLQTNQYVTGGSQGGTINLPIGTYQLEYSYTTSLNGPFIFVTEQFTIGHPIEWTNLIYTTQDPLTLNTITPSGSNVLSTANSTNISENNITNWVEFEWKGTGNSINSYLYSWAWARTYLKDPSGNRLGEMIVVNPGFGLMSNLVYVYDNAGLLTTFYNYQNKPIRVEFSTNSGLTPNFNIVSNGITIAQNGAADIGTSNKLQFYSEMASSSSGEFKGQRVFTVNSLANFCQFGQPENIGYVRLEKELTSGYYTVSHEKLLFEIDGEYFLQPNTALDYSIFATNLQEVAGVTDNGLTIVGSAPVLVKHIAQNGFEIDFSQISINPGYYVLEVVNEKNEKMYLRFKLL